MEGGVLLHPPLTEAVAADCHAQGGAAEPTIKRFGRELLGLFDELGLRILLGLLFSGFAVLIPSSLIQSYLSFPWGIPASLLIALLAYVCAVSSIPLVAVLIAKGASMGAAIVILIAGPATNWSTLLVLSKEFGKRVTLCYALCIALLTVIVAFIASLVLGGA
ncbi:MAG TPA: hypothetical protein ENF82_01655 [Candidatus Methanomethylia archaeon]|nr:hypothetical protein [Candidatus Methanomethylicia archaeon]